MPEPPKNPPLPVGTMTYWGKISAVGWVGERYYWITNKDGLGVAMMPADVVEPDFTAPVRPPRRRVISSNEAPAKNRRTLEGNIG